ncbi:hypothetical protein PF010_g28016 [Phytophthora fragariae]|uniref:Mnd1 HTH domain-containing protein n=1 Tax=Phytophthora fragariae TaxID=53985 RepID=A0A6G0JT50_9STRA|nr:hypothetical protein PF010_g28016 [Phytophthora fragariae]KAE9176519.1 hypothetical protein PF004_g26056 [Phytophthora fragariae]
MTGIGGTSASSTTDAHKIFLTQSRFAMGRKGVSLQEKRERILRIYHEFKDEEARLQSWRRCMGCTAPQESRY